MTGLNFRAVLHCLLGQTGRIWFGVLARGSRDNIHSFIHSFGDNTFYESVLRIPFA